MTAFLRHTLLIAGSMTRKRPIPSLKSHSAHRARAPRFTADGHEDLTCFSANRLPLFSASPQSDDLRNNIGERCHSLAEYPSHSENLLYLCIENSIPLQHLAYGTEVAEQ